MSTKSIYRPSYLPEAEEPTERGSLPSYTGAAQCSGATGIPLSVLKKAKRAGCPAFRNSRVHLADFLKWFFSSDASDQDWSERSKRGDALLKEHKLEVNKGLVVPRSDVQEALSKGTALVFGAIERQFTVDLPPSLKGLAESDIQKKLTEAAEKFKSTLRTELSKLTSPEKPKSS